MVIWDSSYCLLEVKSRRHSAKSMQSKIFPPFVEINNSWWNLLTQVKNVEILILTGTSSVSKMWIVKRPLLSDERLWFVFKKVFILLEAFLSYSIDESKSTLFWRTLIDDCWDVGSSQDKAILKENLCCRVFVKDVFNFRVDWDIISRCCISTLVLYYHVYSWQTV